MEIARVLFDDIDIERERRAFPSGMSWPLVKKDLEDKYRKASRAKGIACFCCDSPVEMVLNEDRACYFRHYEKVSCTGSENYGRYTTTRAAENTKKHQTGKSMLKDLLEGQLKIYGVDVQYGYFYKELLKIIPDLLIYFPSGEIWAIDYITGSRSDNSYHTVIQKRLDAYRVAGFKPFFLVDSDWYSVHPEKPAISLYKAEKAMMRTMEYDEKWKEIVQDLMSDMGELSIIELPPYHTLHPLSVSSLMYVDMNNLEGQLVRFIPIQSHRVSTANAWGYMLHGTIRIPVDQLLSLNSGKTDFKWFDAEESALQESFIQQIIQRYVEKEEKEKIERETRNAFYKKVNANLIAQLHDGTPMSSPLQEISNETGFVESNTSYRVPVSRIVHYRDLIERFQMSERLHKDSVFYSHIKQCEEVIRLFDETGEDRLASIYAMMENMKHALLGE